MEGISGRTWLIFSLIILVFFFVEIKALPFYNPGDENVYLYMGKSLSEGVLPYRDFFYAHPPLQLIIISIVFKIFGFNIVILNLIPLLAIITSAFFLFKLAKERFGDAEAIVAIVLFLFSFSILSFATDFVGAELAVMFLITGFYFFNREKHAISGIFFGLASITRLYSLVPVLIILLILFLANKRSFFKLLIAFSAIFILANIILIALAGQNYLVPVYKYHFMKPKTAEPKLDVFYEIIKMNWFLAASSFLFVFAKNKQRIKDILLITLAYTLFLFSLNKAFEHYFILLLPFLAALGGYSLVNIARKIHPRKIMHAAAIIMSLVFAWNSFSDIAFLEKHSFIRFEAGDEMANFIEAYTKKDAIIFGDDSIVPLLSIITGRKIAFNLIDTNDMLFKSGVADIKDVTSRLEEIDIVIIRLEQGIVSISQFREELQNKCELVKMVSDKYEKDFLFYKCKTKYSK